MGEGKTQAYRLISVWISVVNISATSSTTLDKGCVGSLVGALVGALVGTIVLGP